MSPAVGKQLSVNIPSVVIFFLASSVSPSLAFAPVHRFNFSPSLLSPDVGRWWDRKSRIMPCSITLRLRPSSPPILKSIFIITANLTIYRRAGGGIFPKQNHFFTDSLTTLHDSIAGLETQLVVMISLLQTVTKS